MLAVARRRWLTIAITLLATVTVGLVAIVSLPKHFVAHTEVFVTATGGNSPDQLLSAFTLSQNRAKTYALAVSTPVILAPAARRLSYPGGEGELERRVSAAVALDSVVIMISVDDQDPKRAQVVAATIVEELKSAVPRLESATNPSIDLTVIRPAALPAFPESPNRRMILATSVAGGLLMGGFLAMGHDRLIARRVLLSDQEARKSSQTGPVE